MLYNYKIIALCLAKVQEEFSYQLIKNLNERLDEYGYRLFVYSTANDMFWDTLSETGERAVFDLLDFSWIDALVYYDECLKADALFEKLYTKARSAGKPVIIFDGHRSGCININFDYKGGFENMVRHIVEDHGCRRIHYMSGIKGNSFSDEREGVIRNYLQQKGIDFKPSDISYGGFWAGPTRTAMEKLLSRKEPLPECIICANDAMALEAMVCLQNAGYKVPEDVKITGFDGIEQILYCDPQISSCKCDFGALADKIVELINSDKSFEELCGEYYVLPKLLLTETCGCGNHIDINIAEEMFELNQNMSTFIAENRVLEEYTARIHTSESVSGIISVLKNKYMYDMAIIMKEDCLDESKNPIEVNEDEGYGEDFVVLLDTYDMDRQEPLAFRKDQIVPHLRALMDLHKPLIFVSLHYLNVPMGYACFFYVDYDKRNYNKIFQLTSCLDNGLGGFRNVRYQAYLQKKVEDNYRKDALTGLLNRTGFFREFDALVNKLKEEGGTLSMALADLDNLKFINDNYGHSEGDKAIMAVANALKRACPRAICCRFGGDEMIAVTSGAMDYRVLRGRIDTYMEEYNNMEDNGVIYSASIGIYSVDKPENMNFDEMMEIADAQMYEIKREKKSRRGEI